MWRPNSSRPSERGASKADFGQVVQQRLDARGGGAGRLAYGRAHPDNYFSDIPALKDMLRG
jgi:hypothetical protein